MFRQSISFSLAQLLIVFALLARVDAATLVFVGCYADHGSLVFNETYQYQTSSWCLGFCTPMGDSVLGLTQGADCWCGNAIPSDKVDSSYCNTPCFGFGKDDCGGTGYFSVYLTGVGTLENPEALTESSSSSSAIPSTSTSTSASASTSSPSSSASDSTESATTESSPTTTSTSSQDTANSFTTDVTVTATVRPSQTSDVSSSTDSANDANATGDSSSANSSNSASSSSKSGISGGAIGGIVVGVIAGLAIVAGLVFFFIRRRRRDDDDWSDYHGAKGKSRALGGSSSSNPLAGQQQEKLSSNSFNSGRVAIVDQRLNPVMMERRLSDGSLSDEQDYSRKILRVVNMD
ncbi:hypothetical protein V1517DRAFT_321441 [Lipomyces orientalis]|uniref:Uncharacterized protein n=1 Tax=Lipomyces orientalis TaxID=1233043 RepID=A0ACC3TQD1_9ASCO